MQTIDRSLKEEPNKTQILTNAGKFYSDKLGKYEESIIYYDKALRIDANYVSAIYNKGVALERVGKALERPEFHVEAQLLYDRANKIDPSYNGTFINSPSKLTESAI